MPHSKSPTANSRDITSRPPTNTLSNKNMKDRANDNDNIWQQHCRFGHDKQQAALLSAHKANITVGWQVHKNHK